VQRSKLTNEMIAFGRAPAAKRESAKLAMRTRFDVNNR
jgi:hypothetical protein